MAGIGRAKDLSQGLSTHNATGLLEWSKEQMTHALKSAKSNIYKNGKMGTSMVIHIHWGWQERQLGNRSCHRREQKQIG